MIIFIFIVAVLAPRGSNPTRSEPGSSNRHPAQSPIPSLDNLIDGLQIDVSPCQTELSSGRYEIGISDEFPRLATGERSVIPFGPTSNIICMCASEMHMICTIIITSLEMQTAVMGRISPGLTPLELYPFFRDPPDADNAQFVHPDADEPVRAEIVIYSQGGGVRSNFRNINRSRSPLSGSYEQLPRWPRPLLSQSESSPTLNDPVDDSEEPEYHFGPDRANSAPSTIHYPDQRLPLSICTEGTKGLSCPITLKEFEVGQIVYILQKEREKALSGHAVGCISAEGMAKLKEDAFPLETFRDPLRRTGDSFLTISGDYEAFVLAPDPPNDEIEKAPTTESEEDAEEHVQSVQKLDWWSLSLSKIALVSIILVLLYRIMKNKTKVNIESSQIYLLHP